MRIGKLIRVHSGQALVETVLILPLLLSIILNAINFGYFYLMALNITSSSRSSGIYSIMGGATPSGIAIPAAGPPNCSAPGKTVADLACQDLTGAVNAPSTSNTGFQVCSPWVGVLNIGTTTEHTDCRSYGLSATFQPSDPDPELNNGNTAPAFLLNRVDVVYQFTTPIPLMPFNIIVLAAPACSSSNGTVTCTFLRHVEMRAMQ